MDDAREYKVVLSREADHQLEGLSIALKVSRGEVFRRALALLEAAVEADKVTLVTEGIERNVIVK